jgi:Ca-activated chloride channel family protein
MAQKSRDPGYIERVSGAFMSQWWAALHFLRPQWLWLLIAAPAIYCLHHVRDDIRARWSRYIDPALLDHLIVSRKNRLRFRPIHMACLLIIMGTLAAAGPTWKREQPPFTEDKAPLVIALDLSPTMNAIDVNPTRLERAKMKLRDLLKARNGGHTALFVYAGTTHMVLPFTTDFPLFDLYLSSLSTELMPDQGKNSARALQSISDFLKDEPVPGTILFVTDGIEPKSIAGFRQFAAQQHDKSEIMVLGVGTSQGGPIRIGENRFLTDSSGRRVYSRLDVDQLRSIDREGIPSATITLNDDDIRWVQRHVQHHLDLLQQRDSRMRWIDEGYWLTIPICAIAMFWFRKGWAVRGISAGIAFLFLMQPCEAQVQFSWMDIWLTHDQQGRYYYERGDFKKAAERFDDSQWRGIALAHAGDYEAALNAFALSDTAEAWYNQGNALAHLNRYADAVQTFQEALLKRPSWTEAQENLALMKSLIPKPPAKKKKQEEEEAPDIPPDQVKFDEKGKQGRKAIQQLKLDPKKMEEIWMRNIQTTPADFLRRRFAMQAVQERRP